MNEAGALLPTTEAVRALGAQLLTPELLLFPVRHHSPACAWQLRRWLAEVRPSAVLVEGPRSFNPLIPMLVHPEARMPLAVYTYAVFKPRGEQPARRRAAYYPFCEHSPELVALQAAQALGVPARFIDLDHAEQCLIEEGESGAGPQDRSGGEVGEGGEGGEGPESPEAPDPPASEDTQAAPPSLLDESHYRRSRYLQALATRLGCRHHEELWEHLFEAPATTRTLQQHLVDMAAYCHLARLDCSEDELRADGTLAREAEMAWHIQQALAQRTPGSGPVLAVVGGFHAVALPALLQGGGFQRPALARRPVAEEAAALIRYSQDRLDHLNGYAAGMTSPAWQQRLWEQLLRHDKAGLPPGPRVRQELALTLLFDIALELRTRHGLALPMPALAAAYEHTLRLATLRQRPAPVRDDVLDAVTSCFIKGDADADGALVLAVARRLLTGQAMGRVPPGASTPPLVRDFDQRARRQRLKIDDAEPRRAVLDLYRRADHRITSRLFHGLNLLGVPLAHRSAGPDFVNGLGLDRLQEHWHYTHTAATEAALVEASLYGTTVPLAVSARFAEKLQRFENGAEPRHAQAAAALLAQACVLGLHDHVPKICRTLAAVVADDAKFESVAMAAGALGLLLESREPLEARGIEALPALLQAAYERALYLGRGLSGGPGGLVGPAAEAGGGGTGASSSGGPGAGADQGPAQREVVAGLLRLRELLASEAGARLDAPLFWALVGSLQAGHDAAFVRGAAAGLAYGAGQLAEPALATLVQGHLQGLAQPHEAVAFLRGLLHTAREAAWQQPALLQVLDTLLSAWPDADFVANLPELRLAFAEMTPKETDRIAQAVAGLHGAAELGRLLRYDISAEQVQAHLATSQQLLEVLQGDGLAPWVAA